MGSKIKPIGPKFMVLFIYLFIYNIPGSLPAIFPWLRINDTKTVTAHSTMNGCKNPAFSS